MAASALFAAAVQIAARAFARIVLTRLRRGCGTGALAVVVGAAFAAITIAAIAALTTVTVAAPVVIVTAAFVSAAVVVMALGEGRRGHCYSAQGGQGRNEGILHQGLPVRPLRRTLARNTVRVSA
jgi:hypothetical protein